MSAVMSSKLPSLDYGVGAGVAVLVAGLIALGVVNSARMPLNLDIYGDTGRIDLSAVREAVLPHLGEGFFGLDPQPIEARLLAQPWVSAVQVQRLWPDRLAVHLRSHTPVANWGEQAVLTAEGSLIWPQQQPELPLRVEGPTEQLAAAFADLQVVVPALPVGWSLSRWRISATGDRAATLVIDGQSLELEFGREPVAEKFRLLAELVVPQLAARWDEVAAVDLRYRNGFAVRWRTPAAGQEQEQ